MLEFLPPELRLDLVFLRRQCCIRFCLSIASVKNWKYCDNLNTRAGCEHFFIYWRWLPPTGENGNVQYPRMSGAGCSTWTSHQGLKHYPCSHTEGCKRGRREFAAICSNCLSEAWVTQSLRELGWKPLSTGGQAPDGEKRPGPLCIYRGAPPAWRFCLSGPVGLNRRRIP